MADKTGLPTPNCLTFACNTPLEAYELDQLAANADASLSNWWSKVVANSPQNDVVCGYVGNYYEVQKGYTGAGASAQTEYYPHKHPTFRVDLVDATTFANDINPAFIQFRDFPFEVSAWETEYSLIMHVYRRQFEEVSNIAAGPHFQVEQWQESNYPEAGGATSWVMNQLIRIEYHDGTSVLVLVDEADNATDIPLNVRLCSADGNAYTNSSNDLLALGYTPPNVGETRVDFIRVMVLNIRGSLTGNSNDWDQDSYFVMNPEPQPLDVVPCNDYAGIEYVHFSMSKSVCS